jgi:hypothetical protein
MLLGGGVIEAHQNSRDMRSGGRESEPLRTFFKTLRPQ